MVASRQRDKISATSSIVDRLGRALAICGRNKAKLAESLEISHPTLRKLMRGIGIDVSTFHEVIDLLERFEREHGLEQVEEVTSTTRTTGERRIEALIDELIRADSPLWDLPADKLFAECQQANWYARTYESLAPRCAELLELDCARQLAVGHFLQRLADLTYASHELTSYCQPAVRLGIAIVSPLLTSRSDDVRLEANILAARLNRDKEGVLWSFAEVPAPPQNAAANVLTAYHEVAHHLENALGKPPYSSLKPHEIRLLHVTEVCKARTHMQLGNFDEAIHHLDVAAGINGRDSYTSSIYRSHLQVAKGERRKAIDGLGLLLANVPQRDRNHEEVEAIQLRIFELSEGADYRDEAMEIIQRPGLRIKCGDVANFANVSCLLNADKRSSRKSPK